VSRPGSGDSESTPASKATPGSPPLTTGDSPRAGYPPRCGTNPARRLTVLLRSRDHVGHHSLMVELIDRARKAGLAGATALQAIDGYGRSGTMHREHLFTEDLPIAVVIVDEAARIDAFLAETAELLDSVVVLLDDVEIFGEPLTHHPRR
jgi:PII-like signaling protein